MGRAVPIQPAVTPPPLSTSEKGARTELAVTSALLRAGLTVYLPFFSAHARVDLIYEDSAGGYRRVQCKTAHVIGDVMMFYTCSHTGGVQRTYVGEVDEFGVYCEEAAAVYLVPIDEVPARLASLRLKPTRNNQQRRVRWAEPYRLGPPW